MKKERFATTVIALFVACNFAFGQDLKPLKSFDGDENEYIRYNFGKGDNRFIGGSFGDLINTIEVKFLSAKIYYTIDNSSLHIYLYLQSYGYVSNKKGRKEMSLTGIVIYFDENENLETAVKNIKKMLASTQYSSNIISLNKKKIDKLIDLLKDVKIESASYRRTTSYVILKS